jgi:hypothetical protein
MLLDEVAAHLDAGRRAALFDEICALGAQAWMTGTGPRAFRRARRPGAAPRRANPRWQGARGPRARDPHRRTTGLYATALFVLFLTPGPVWLAHRGARARPWLGRRGAAGAGRGAGRRALVGHGGILGLAWIVGTYGWVMDVLRWVAVAVFALMGLLLIRHADKTISADSA